MVIEDGQITENLNSEEVQSQENLSSQESQPAETVDYSTLSLSELISAMEKFCTKELVEANRKSIEDIRTQFYKRQKSETAEARKRYIEENGSLEGFVFDSKENEFKEVYGRIKELRARLLEQKQKEQEKNLQIKESIIERLGKLTEAPESMNKTYAEYRALQEEWKNSGDVDPTKEKTVWESYHLQVAKFYDYVKLNREFRDLDQKKNYEAKEQLCEKAEALVDAKQIVKAYADLQVLHEEWRKIGPVKEEFKEKLWERFQAATKAINKAHQDYFASIKQLEEENLRKKTALCEKMDEIILDLELTQKQWTAKTAQVQEIQKEWRTIGYAPQKQNTLIYERFSKACDVFFSARKSFFGEVHEVENENKKKKVALCEKAEEMLSRTDWSEATSAYIKLQKEWKTIGSTNFKDSQKLWNRFTKACNAFFEAKKDFENKQNNLLVENIAVKEGLIKKITEISDESKDEAMKSLSAIQAEWANILVPASAKAELQNKYNEAVSALLKKLNIEKSQADDWDFRAKISAMLLEKSGEEKVIKEARRIKNKLNTVQSEINSLENNVGFFSKSSDASKLIANVEKNIEKGKKEIAQLEHKLQVINSILHENK